MPVAITRSFYCRVKTTTTGIMSDGCRPVVIEVPHFASLRDGEREISVLRSDDGQTWTRHVQAASDAHEDVQEVIKATTGGMLMMSPHLTLNITPAHFTLSLPRATCEIS